MTDMLVNLYVERDTPDEMQYRQHGIRFQRALAIDKAQICAFVSEHFSDISAGWVDECASTLHRHPTGCFLAVRDKAIIGFACYDATAKGMIGPLGVAAEFRKQGVARLLLSKCLDAMKMDGYAYAVIGWVSSQEYYQKACGAIPIPDSFPGVYERMVMHN